MNYKHKEENQKRKVEDRCNETDVNSFFCISQSTDLDPQTMCLLPRDDGLHNLVIKI